jgi:hypothetical protein
MNVKAAALDRYQSGIKADKRRYFHHTSLVKTCNFMPIPDKTANQVLTAKCRSVT